jgi:hypothetical protein
MQGYVIRYRKKKQDPYIHFYSIEHEQVPKKQKSNHSRGRPSRKPNKKCHIRGMNFSKPVQKNYS